MYCTVIQSDELLELCGKRPLVSEAMITFHASVIADSDTNGSARNPSDRANRPAPRSVPTQDQWTGTLTSAQKSLTDLLNTTQVRYTATQCLIRYRSCLLYTCTLVKLRSIR